MRHYIYVARNRGGFLCAERTLCAPLPRILFSERDVFRVPGQPGPAVSAASLCSPSPADDLRPAVRGHFNNNSWPICLSRTVSGYLCLGRSRECGNGGLLAKSTEWAAYRMGRFVNWPTINRLLSSRNGLIYPAGISIRIRDMDNFIFPLRCNDRGRCVWKRGKEGGKKSRNVAKRTRVRNFLSLVDAKSMISEGRSG